MRARITVDEQALQRTLDQALDRFITRRQVDLDRLSNEMNGRPVDEVRAAVKAAFEHDSGSLTDPELSQYADVIANGDRIALTRADGA